MELMSTERMEVLEQDQDRSERQKLRIREIEGERM